MIRKLKSSIKDTHWVSFYHVSIKFSYSLIGDSMGQTTFAFLLTVLAGLSTMIGSILIFIKVNNSNKLIASSLGFAAGVMMTVSITDLIPESIHSIESVYRFVPSLLIVAIFITIGIIFSMMIDRFLPEDLTNTNKKGLSRVGVISMLAIIFHNIPEGIATFMTTSSHITLGIALTIAIAMHNIPEGISISIPIYYATGSRLKALFYTFVSGLSEPLGAILAYLILRPFVNDMMMGCLYAIIAGIMLHISIYELIPTSFSYQYKRSSKRWIFIGIVFMLINHFLF